MRQADEIAQDIWALVKQEISCACPFFGHACYTFEIIKSDETESLCTDGRRLFYSTEWLFDFYEKKGRLSLNRSYLHVLFHVLYLHPSAKKSLDIRLWHLACDIISEYTIDYMEVPQLTGKVSPEREAVYETFWKKREARNAEGIYIQLKEKRYPDACIEKWEHLFHEDDHTCWDKISDDRSEEMKEQWKKITEGMGSGGGKQGKIRGTAAGNRQEWFEIQEKRRYDYRKFLRRFTVEREEVQLDMESFDYIYYCMGLQRYGNMPLVEPLEYTEANKLEEIIIAIDTSSSCNRDTVQRFLEETYSILSRRENFFKKMNVHIVQCDCYIQDHVNLTREEDWKSYMKHIKIQGRGGTDFRPVFTFVQKLQKEKRVKNLKGLIYFTDGDGIFPTAKPSYDAAFVFIKEPPEQVKIPSWVIRLYLDERGTGK